MPEEIEIKREMPISPEQEIGPETKPEKKLEILSEEKERKEIIVKPEIKKEIPEEIKEIKNLDQKNQVKALCDLAFQKGLDYSIKTARSLDNAYVLDEFHDTLIDKLHEQLIEKGRLAGK